MASPASNEVVRLREGGEVVERIATRQRAIACMLGGSDQRTLYILTAESTVPAFCIENHTARIEAVHVECPGVGWP